MFSLARDNDTICAISTAPGIGAIAIVRLSGAQAAEITRALMPTLADSLESHRIYYGHLIDPKSKELVDEVLVSFFANGKSFTGEECVEISCHGSPAITQQILKLCISQGARMAEPGEFTYRAFSNERIDLIQAEGVLQLIESKTVQASRMAIRQLEGELSNEFHSIEESLVWCMAQLEANIDFAAEDIVVSTDTQILTRLDLVAHSFRRLLDGYERGRLIRDGIRGAIVGAPNVGKSSFLNFITSTNRSIVSATPGTTRDRVDAEISLFGQNVTLMDTAGLRNSDDDIELAGISIARAAAKEADFLIFIFDVSNLDSRNIKDELMSLGKPIIEIGNKSDLLETSDNNQEYMNCLLVSTKNRTGLESVFRRISELFSLNTDFTGGTAISARQFESLTKAQEHLMRALELLISSSSGEFILSELNEVLLQCYNILGKKYDDQILDKVFKDFCLGK